jgi:hypothetical protein
MTTRFSDICAILTEIRGWDEENLQDFYAENEIGFAFAFGEAHGHTKTTPTGEDYVISLWNQLLVLLDVKDTGFEDIKDLNDAIELSQAEVDEQFLDMWKKSLAGEA